MSGDVRRRIGALERVAGDVGAESGDGEPIDLAALAEAVAVSIERYSSDSNFSVAFSRSGNSDRKSCGEASARGYVWRSLAEVIGEAVQE